MFKTIVLATILTAFAMVLGTKPHAEDYTTFTDFEAIVKRVNQVGSTWVAAAPPNFRNTTVAQQKLGLGTIMPGEEGYERPEVFRQNFKVCKVTCSWVMCRTTTSFIVLLASR